MLDSGRRWMRCTEILKVIKLDSAIYLNAEFSEPWCIPIA